MNANIAKKPQEDNSCIPGPAATNLAVSEVLTQLLEEFQPVDFRDYLDVPEGNNIKQKQLVVGIVKVILGTVSDKKWGMARRNDSTYVFNGKYWQHTEASILRTFLGKAAEKMGIDWKEAAHYEFQDKLLKQFEAAANFLDPKPGGKHTLINLQNCTLEINGRSFKKRPHNPDDFLTYILPFEYDPKADAPLFIQYLDRVLPDTASQRVLGEFLGYTFTKDLKLEKCGILYGDGQNGKSVMFDIVNAVMGRENISNFSLGSLKQEHNRAMIADKLINYGSEIKGDIESDIFKQLVSGEPTSACFKYRNPFIMEDIPKLMFNANTFPKDVEHSTAYFRRFLIIPFTETISEEEKDPDLAQKIIRNELPGILNWIMIGLDRILHQRKFSECAAANEVLNTFKRESDSVALFLEQEGWIANANRSVLLKEAYGHYKSFCIDEGFRALSSGNFRKRLNFHRIGSQKTNQGQVLFMEKVTEVTEMTP